MKTTGQGNRLKELLQLRFKNQKAAADALGCNQPDISRYINRYTDKPLPPYFWQVYAPKLRQHGVNTDHIEDPTAPKLLPEYARQKAQELLQQAQI